MSGDTVTSKALQFTNDNKRIYGYTGLTQAVASETTIIDYDMNSSYAVCIVQPFYIEDTSENIQWNIKINDITVSSYILTSATANTPVDEIHITIPPNVNFKITTINKSGGNIDVGVTVNGKVGMPQRVGNNA